MTGLKSFVIFVSQPWKHFGQSIDACLSIVLVESFAAKANEACRLEPQEHMPEHSGKSLLVALVLYSFLRY